MVLYTPMFPLGTVLLPGMPLPLRIFEPRYQQMLTEVLAGDRTFGVVLIERGHEVGGGDSRSSVGTLARIKEHQPSGDGQHVILAVGTDRIRIQAWLPDDPYPRAQVTPWPDELDLGDTGSTRDQPDQDDRPNRADLVCPNDEGDLFDLYLGCTSDLRRLLATAVELGLQVAPATFDTPSDPVPGSYFLASLTPVGPFDRQRLLEAPGPHRRLMLLTEMIQDQLALITGGPTQV